MTNPPSVWLLLGDRVGDNNQVLRLAEALDWPHEVKNLKYRWPLYRRANILLGARLTSLDREASDPLSPPWPDLVISIGRRSVPVMRWIRKQSGGRTKLVTLGRPRAPLWLFNLVISTPQYRLPDRPNVVHIPVPLHRITDERLEEARRVWVPRLEHLPRPRFAVLVGGRASSYRFDAATAADLGRCASKLAKDSGGSLLVSTSSRTELEAREALFAAIDAPSYLYTWKPGDPENPYFGFLADADAFIVTGESISMLTESLSTGRPVQIYSFPFRRKPYALFKERLNRLPVIRWLLLGLVSLGFMNLPRDHSRVRDFLIEAGLASKLGDPMTEQSVDRLNSLELVVARVRVLFPEAPGPSIPRVQRGRNAKPS